MLLRSILATSFFALILPPTIHAAPPEIAELPGPVVIAGAGDLSKDAIEAFFTLAGKEKAKILVIAPDGANEEDVLKPWRELKPASIAGVKSGEAQAAKSLDDATGVWVDGTKFASVEKSLRKFHTRGGVVGGGSALLDLGLLPGFHTKSESGSVGLSLEAGAAIVIRGRTMRVIGEKHITIRIAKGAGHPVAVQEAAAGSLFDLFQLRRAAANRAAKEPFPPAKPKEPVLEKGSLVIVGGGGTTPAIMNAFFEKAGGKDALIVVIPTTAEDGPGDAAYIKKFGATNVKLLFTLDRKLADDPKFSETLTEAGGVWFGGGRQWRFVDSFEGTLVEKRCHEVLARGGVIGGSSAGASIQSEYMPRGHPLGNTVMAAEGYERGFGFLPGCAVDQHFFARKRTADMTGLMKDYPQYLGIGIDESTAIVVTGSVAEVMGRSKVAFYDAKKPTQPDYEWDAGGHLVWFDRDYDEVKAGEKYDLKKREKVK